MNKLFELLQQSEVSITHVKHFNGHIDIERFAKLIVEECIDVINKTPNGYRDYRNQIEDAMRNACVDDIKQHFGVE